MNERKRLQEVGETAGHEPWHAIPAAGVLDALGSSAKGLSPEEAADRLAKFGLNEIREARTLRPLAILAAQFSSFIVWLLIVAAVIAGLLGEGVDALAILAIVLLNGGIGFYQEFKAEKSIAAMRKLTAPQAHVRRGGRLIQIPAEQLVAGDVVRIEAGDLLSADARVIRSTALSCDEAALTGESEPSEKSTAPIEDRELPLGDRANMVFKGTSVAAGHGTAVVVATGMQTELGRIAGLIQESGTGERTPLQEKLGSFGRILAGAAIGIVALMFLLGTVRGMEFLELFMTSVSLAVAAVPEGLPAIVTIALGVGVLRMSRRRTLVRKLPSVETLGSTSVICTDKTGTLTVGEMTARELFVAGHSYEVTGEGYGPHGEILIEGRTTGAEHAGPLLELATALMASNNAELILEDDSWRVVGDPTEGALLVAGHKAGARRDSVERDLPRHHEIPFDSERKRRTVIRRMPEGQLRAFVSGAPDVLIARCTKIYTETGPRQLTDADRRAIEERNETMAGRALRVLAAAYRDLPQGTKAGSVTEDMEHGLTFVGLAGMQDPPRPEAKEAVSRCRAAGIRVVMITGDHPRTAIAIARQLGLLRRSDSVVTGRELDGLDDEELRQRAPRIGIYARVSAEHKLRIVRAWQAGGAVVAMTGDGVNDAPALKGADIGVAMGIKGTEVAKQASAMIITEDNFASSVAAVEQGRGIYDNIRLTLHYLLAGNAAELLLMAGCIVVGLPAPLLPIHLLWINLVTDGMPALCLATSPIDPGVMSRPPRPRTERISDRSFFFSMGVAGLVTAVVSFAMYLWGLRSGTVETARSMAFSALVFCEVLKSFGFQSEARPFWKVPFLGNLQLPIVVVSSIGLQFLVLHSERLGRLLKTVTPTLAEHGMLLVVGMLPLCALELSKLLRMRQPGSVSAPHEE